MKKHYLGLVTVFLLLALAIAGRMFFSPTPRPIPVLMYHDLVAVDPGGLSDWTVTADKFRQDLQYLQDNGYTTVLPRELVAGAALPDKPVMITFDDGYESNYTLALPILEELDSKAVIALITQRIDSRKPGFLTWEQCQALENSGLVELGSHTHDTHTGEQPGILRREGERRADYEARVFSDLELSVTLIHNNLGTHVTYFAHPQGQKDQWAEDFVKKLFPVTTTSQPGIADLNQGTWDMPRYNVSMTTPLSQFLDPTDKP